jgi:dTDP-4-dehydrorhamnose 3,5-epimerase
MPFIITPTEIPNVQIISPSIFRDQRGYFVETFRFTDFQKSGISESFTQDCYSYSFKNVLRGLHYNHKPFRGGKLVMCLSGRVREIVVDLRPSSKTFKRWVSVELSGESPSIVYVPFGCAHGYLVLSDGAYIGYKLSKEYSPGDDDKGLRWNDPEINIQWPVSNPIISQKDAANPLLKDADLSAFREL